jgi:hypothetical protein
MEADKPPRYQITPIHCLVYAVRDTHQGRKIVKIADSITEVQEFCRKKNAESGVVQSIVQVEEA